MSLPWPVALAAAAHGTQYIKTIEKDNLEGLEKAGFKLGYGKCESGIFGLYLTRGGGYYIDTGCSQLIIDGKIKVKQGPEGIAGFKPHSIVLKDGTELEADIVVLATGYENMRSGVRKALGDRIADRCRDVWDLDEEGELNAVSSDIRVKTDYQPLFSNFLFFFFSPFLIKSGKRLFTNIFIFLPFLDRSGAQADIPDSGSLVAILGSVEFIPSF
jgi:hypothetical protein